MRIVRLEAAEFFADTPSGVNEAGFYLEVDADSFSGPFADEAAALGALALIARGEVDDVPLLALLDPPVRS
jgi:hypothetical protein